jgi:hypothetical protein
MSAEGKLQKDEQAGADRAARKKKKEQEEGKKANNTKKTPGNKATDLNVSNGCTNEFLEDLKSFAIDDRMEDDGATKLLFEGKGINSPDYEKGWGEIGVLKSSHRYKAATTTVHKTTPPKLVKLTKFINWGTTLSSKDKPGEVISKMKNLLKNMKFLDPTAGLLELSPHKDMQPKIIVKENNIPTNFMLLDKFMILSSKGLFKAKKKNWNKNI